MHIGSLIKRHREKQGLSMNELARRADVGQSGLSDIEACGKRQPTFDWLERVVKALNLTWADFFSEEEPDLPVHIRELISNAQKLSPAKVEILNQFIKAITEPNAVKEDPELHLVAEISNKYEPIAAHNLDDPTQDLSLEALDEVEELKRKRLEKFNK
jgi:transcriptional regulator with XRE-family HTH domain